MKLNWIIPLFAAAGLALAGCGGGGSSPKAATEMPQPSPYEVAQTAIAAADTAAAAQAAVDAAVAAGITGAQLQSLNMAVAERTAAIAAAAAAEQRQMLVAAAACTDATAACVAAHDALIAALQADVAALQADDNATNAEVNAAQMALAEAQSTRNAINMALVEIDRSTATGSAVGAAVDAANALEDARDPADIEAAEMLLATAKGMLTDSDDYASQIAAAEMSIARAKERNSVDAAVMAAEAAATGLASESGVDAVTAAQALVEAANMAIDGAEHLTDAEKAAQTAKVTAAQGTVTVAKNANDEAARLAQAEADRKAEEEAAAKAKEMAAAGKALKGRLGDTPLSNLDLTSNAASLTSAGLTVGLPAGPGGTPAAASSPRMRPGDSAGSIAGWAGSHYAHTNAGTRVTNSAVAYTNRAAPRSRTPAAAFPAANYTAATRVLTGFAGSADSNIAGDGFADAGTMTHTPPAVAGTNIQVRGTYMGAAGVYICDTGAACTSAAGASGVITLTGTWTFVHDVGAMTSEPDANYLYFGWWLQKDVSGAAGAPSS